MKEDIKNILTGFNALPENKRKVIAKNFVNQREKESIEAYTNANIADREEFRNFCSEKNITPTKRQAGKLRNEFIEWYKQKQE